MASIGYARVSTDDQVTESQVDALRGAGCSELFEEHASGSSRSRPVLAKAVARVSRGDTLVVVQIDRLARSLAHLLEVIEHLKEIGANFRSLRDPIDTGSPQGEFTLQILGAVAQLERKLISQRTTAALKAARIRGRVGGNPALRAKDPAAIRKLSLARSGAYLSDVILSAEEWLPTVRRMRPDRPWKTVVATLNAGLPPARHWTVDRLKRAVKLMVSEGMAAPGLLDRAEARKDVRLLTLAAGIARANPGLTLQEIGRQLAAMRERPPRGGNVWHPSSVKSLLDQARSRGLL